MPYNALKKGKLLFQHLLGLISEGVWIWNVKNNNLFFSSQYYIMLGYEPNEFPATYEEWEKRVHPDDLGFAKLSIGNWPELAENLFENKFRMQTKSGDYLIIKARAKIIKSDSKGHPEQVIGNYIDVTEKVEINLALIESEERLRNLINNMEQGVGFYDIEGNILLFNNQAAKLMGGEPKDFINKNMRDIFPEEDGKIYIERMESIQKSDKSMIYYDEIKLPDLDNVWFKSTYLNVLDIDKKLTGIMIILEDITSVKKAEKDKIVSETAYRLLFENMAQGVFYQSNDGQLIDINSAALEIFGISKNEFLNRTSLTPAWKVIDTGGNLIEGDNHPSMKPFKTGKPFTQTVGVFNPEKGDYTWVIANSIPQFLENEKEPYQVFVTMHDITRQWNAEKKLQGYQENLEKVVAERTLELNEKNAELLSYNRLFNGREFRIKELRDKVEKLEKLLKQNKIRCD